MEIKHIEARENLYGVRLMKISLAIEWSTETQLYRTFFLKPVLFEGRVRERIG